MREGRKWVHWLVAALFAGSLALTGCADDGDTGPQGPPGEPTLEAGNFVGVGNCAACHAGSTVAEKYAESAHANQGPHSIDSCSQSCHNPLGEGDEVSAAFGVSTPNAVGCESCHGPGSGHYGVGPIPEAAPDTTVCGQCHDGTIADGTAHIEHHPFNAEITSRFQTSRHANQHPREAFCSACHSHEGGVALLQMGGAEDVIDLATKFNPDTVDTWSLAEEELSTKQCSTCHEPHTLDLRGEGDTMDAEGNVVYSAEFNLCTTCHMVDLDETPAEVAGLYEYELSSAYTAESMVDAAAGTYIWEEFEIVNADGTTRTREVYQNQVHYHDNGSPEIIDGEYHDHNIGRKFAETHFSGQMIGAIAGLDADSAAGIENTTIPGYNVNAGAEDACTVCHDPHTGGKILSTAEGQHDDPTNLAVDYAEGVGEFHKNYLGEALNHGCQPCHDGGENFVAATYGASFGDSYGVENPIGCRDCHTLEVENTVTGEPGDMDATNNAEAMQQVRTFTDEHVFAFNSGVEVPAAELGVNQICFECHKGRSGALTAAEETALPAGETDIREFAYFHYAPAYATLFGVESGMVPLYQDPANYSGRFEHIDITDFSGTMNMGCADCHNVHDTDGNDVAQNKMANPDFSCVGCHTGDDSPAALEAETAAYSDALLDAIYNEVLTYTDGDTTNDPVGDDITGFAVELQTMLTDVAAAATEADAKMILAAHLEGRTNTMPTVALAKASNSWKIFTYEDGAVDGNFGVHGHGGSWAHNGNFAQQVMFDAINSLGVDPAATYSLTRP